MNFMVEVFTFALVGIIIFIGFLGSKFFKKTKVSEVLILMLAGFLIGPVFNIVDATALVQFIPFFAGVALIVLLFDGGLNLNFERVLNELASASAFTFFTFSLSAIAIGIAAHFLLGWEWLLSFMFGAVVGGTSSPIVITLVDGIRAREETKTLLKLESALTDALTIVVAITLAEIIVSHSFSASSALSILASEFSIATVVGVIAGIVWMNFLKGFTGNFDYMLTIAVAFFLYGLVGFTGGNGGIAVLAFGIILGNSKQLSGLMSKASEEAAGLPAKFREFQSEISFFVRTFFFTYMGLILNPAVLKPDTLLAGAAITVVALAARWLSARSLGYSKNPDARLIITMMPRGLAAAVLSTLPSLYGLSAPGFTEMVMLVIIGSNIITTIGVAQSEVGVGGVKGGGSPQIVAINAKNPKPLKR